MKKKKAIVIKNPLLRNLRNNLRKIILEAVYRELKRLSDEERQLMFKNHEIKEQTLEEKERERFLFDKQTELRRAKSHSICKCPVCSQTDKDMVYNTKMQEWYCLDCYNELPKSLIPDWHPEYPLSSEQIEVFFHKLDKVAVKCNMDFKLSKRILKSICINKGDQNKFFDVCKEYGGYCDCEILMNTYKSILLDLKNKKVN